MAKYGKKASEKDAIAMREKKKGTFAAAAARR
jgi:hypothetical protein